MYSKGRIFSFYLFILFILNSFLVFSQELTYKDLFKGGVIGAGYSPRFSTVDTFSGFFYINNIPNNSTIRKAFLLSGRHGIADDITIYFNNDEYMFSSKNQISSTFNSYYGGESGVHMVDVTNSIVMSQNQYSILSNGLIPTTSKNRYSDFYLLLFYENTAYSDLEIVLFTNNKNSNCNYSYNIDLGLSVIDTLDIGLSFFGSYICDTISDGSFVSINNTNIGLIGGNDINSGECGGPSGNFFYENGQLNGHLNDSPTPYMSGNDVIANVQIYNLNNFFNISLNHQIQCNLSNNLFGLVFAYSTPCEPFNGTLHTKDTTICYGETVRLLATGGQKYEWQPSTGLSCTECPAPFASPKESTTYTVRIWNNDSCNKVLPVRVNISQPKPSNKEITATTCGESNGKIEFGEIPNTSLSLAPYTYVINGDTSELGYKHHLAAGSYQYSIIDARGCSYTDTVQIEEINQTEAVITSINPTSGEAPLEINASTSYSIHYYINNENFTWIVNNDSIEGQFLNYVFDQHGEHEIILITYNQYPHCADTVSTTILVYPSFFANIPNVFSPNADGVNDVFEVKVSNVKQLSWQIKNRWGNIVSEGSQSLDDSTQNVTLWDGKNANDGVYFYVITATDFNGKVYEKQGKVSVFR